MARKSKPSQIAQDLEKKRLEARRKGFEAVNLSADMADLVKNADVETNLKSNDRTVDHNTARRVDAFDALKDGMDKGCFDAARRLERDLLVRRGEGDRGRVMERVDGGESKDLIEVIVSAAKDCEYIKSRLSRRDFWLLSELVVPTKEHTGWRSVVYYVTGEADKVAQAAAVRAASVNLRDAYVDLDEARMDRRAA